MDVRSLLIVGCLLVVGCGNSSVTTEPATDDPLLYPPGRSEAFEEMEVPPNHFTHSEGIGAKYRGRDAGHVQSTCLNCHTTSQTSFATEEWAASWHALAGISCEACHGTHEVAFVPHPGPDRCRACHPQQELEMRRGQHADVAGSGIRCDSCHRAHAFDLGAVKDPATCTACHKDSPHVQQFATSKMGVIFQREGFDDEGVPEAATCHMCHVTLSPVHETSSDLRCDTVMNHDVSAGMARVKEGGPLTEEAREAFVVICLQCHARAISEYRMRQPDPIITHWQAGGR